MKRFIQLLILFLINTVCIYLNAQTIEDAVPPSPEEITKMEKAIPDKPSVIPKMPRKLLVFSGAQGYYHSSIPFCKKAIELIGKRTGAFEVISSEDISIFEPETLKQFDAVLFNNSCMEIFRPENFEEISENEKNKVIEREKRLKQSLKNYISGGKGFVLIHAGIAAFHQGGSGDYQLTWKEFGKISGASFINHPWVAGSTVTLKVDDPNHPVSKAFDGGPFIVSDEIYQVNEPYSRDKLHVLLSIDTKKTNMNVDGIHRKDKDFAISWVKNYGKGRVFYCALGHQHELYWNRIILQHYLDGIQYVLGDIQ